MAPKPQTAAAAPAAGPTGQAARTELGRQVDEALSELHSIYSRVLVLEGMEAMSYPGAKDALQRASKRCQGKLQFLVDWASQERHQLKTAVSTVARAEGMRLASQGKNVAEREAKPAAEKKGGQTPGTSSKAAAAAPPPAAAQPKAQPKPGQVPLTPSAESGSEESEEEESVKEMDLSEPEEQQSGAAAQPAQTSAKKPPQKQPGKQAPKPAAARQPAASADLRSRSDRMRRTGTGPSGMPRPPRQASRSPARRDRSAHREERQGGEERVQAGSRAARQRGGRRRGARRQASPLMLEDRQPEMRIGKRGTGAGAGPNDPIWVGAKGSDERNQPGYKLCIGDLLPGTTSEEARRNINHVTHARASGSSMQGQRKRCDTRRTPPRAALSGRQVDQRRGPLQRRPHHVRQ